VRNIDGKIWSQKCFFKLSQEEKLLYLYFITSDHTDDLGIYQVSQEYIPLETQIENYKDLLRGNLSSKIFYSEELDLIFIRDINQYSFGKSKDYRKSIYNKLLSLEENIRNILLKESKYLLDIYKEFSQEGEIEGVKDKEETVVGGCNEGVVEGEETVGGGCRDGVERVPEKEKEKEIPLSKEKEKERSPLILSPKEKEKEITLPLEREKERGEISCNADALPSLGETVANATEENPVKPENNLAKKKNSKKKYSKEALELVKEFKTFREDFLKIPITQKDWHLRALAVSEKLLKKYPLEELKEALKDLRGEYWEDKAGKIIEMWHFEDWLPKWRVWKKPIQRKEEIYKGINITEWKKWLKETYNKEAGGDIRRWIDWFEEGFKTLPDKKQLYWREEYKRVNGVYPEEDEENNTKTEEKEGTVNVG